MLNIHASKPSGDDDHLLKKIAYKCVNCGALIKNITDTEVGKQQGLIFCAPFCRSQFEKRFQL
jgi:DNA-directed RNA polymerase subunit RPC12/RpoP